MEKRINTHLILDIAIVCEDVREETRNKFSAMGVMSGDAVNVPLFPAPIRLAFFLGVKSDKVGTTKFKIRVSFEGAMLMEGETEVTFTESALYGNLIIPAGIINVAKPGQLIFALSADGGEWVEAISREIRIGS